MNDPIASPFSGNHCLSRTYERTPHCIQHTIRRVYLLPPPPPLSSFTDQNPLSTRTCSGIFLYLYLPYVPYSSPCSPFSAVAWALHQIVSLPAYIICDFGSRSMGNTSYVDITCLFLNQSFIPRKRDYFSSLVCLASSVLLAIDADDLGQGIIQTQEILLILRLRKVVQSQVAMPAEVQSGVQRISCVESRSSEAYRLVA